MEKLFISSVQKEFSQERRAIAEYLREDPLLGSFFEPFLFEEVPATTASPGAVYLEEVQRSHIYIAILGTDYGFEDADGISPTEREYAKAKETGIPRWVYIKGGTDTPRHPKQEAFIRLVGEDVSRKRWNNLESLKREIYGSCILHLRQTGKITGRDFDSSLNSDATLEHLNAQKISEFVAVAREKRNFPFKTTTPPVQVLQHLHLLRNGKLTNSALLAFGTDPQSFFPTATIKCAHFHGLIIEKPIPDYKEFGGTVFEMAEKALDFVLSKISLSTGTRSDSNRVTTIYEIPRAVIAEAIINAVAHRDYQSNGSVQVSVFKNRVEIQNPGDLPEELSLSDLLIPHGSYPHNPLLANCLFLTGDIERYGTGTLEMCKRSEERGLTTPQFTLPDGFKVCLWREIAHVTGHVTTHDAVHDATHDATHDRILVTGIYELSHRLVYFLSGEMGRAEMMVAMGLKNRAHFTKNYVEPALANQYIEMTIPESPTSKKQKYRLTEKGQKLKSEILRDSQPENN